MLKRIVISASWVAGLMLATGTALAAPLPETLVKALEGAEMDTLDGWAFRKTTLVDAMDDPAVKTVTLWDPSKPKDEQCTLVSMQVLGKAKGDAADDKPCDENHDRQVYGDLRELLADAVIEKVSEDADLATYRITPSDAKRGFSLGGLDINIDGDDAQRLVGTVEVVKTGQGAPYVKRVGFELKEPTGNLVARMRKLEVAYTYTVDPATGAKLMNGMAVDMDLNLFALLNVTTKVVTLYDEFRQLQ